MKCPIDNEALVMSDRQGIEIDYCPTCRGVWLDRGELDKIIERSGAQSAPASTFTSRIADHHDDTQRRSSHDTRNQDAYKHGYKKKRENFLGELFDF